MLKKTVTYTDYNGNVRTEDFYFNLTKPEIVEMELSVDGGLTQMIKKIVGEQNNREIVKVFKELLRKAYGEKSADGKYFVKSEELTNKFMQTEAYSDIFMELATNAEAAAAFVNALVPQTRMDGGHVEFAPDAVPEQQQVN